MRLRVGAGTDRGRLREQNEDVYMVRAAQGLFVVCDGMGGAPGGEVASRIAAQAIVDHLDGALEEAAPPSEGEEDYLPRTRQLAEAVRASNRVIHHHRHQDARHAQMGTTVVGAWVQQHTASVAHVGDSRAYLWHDGRLEALTRDHSLLEAFAGYGLPDQAYEFNPDPQNTLVRVLGGEPDVDVDLREVLVQPGDYLLLCSDGFTRMVSEAALAEAMLRLHDPRHICGHLIDTANRNGGVDNITVVVVQVVDDWWQRVCGFWQRFGTGGQDAEVHSQV
jgi:serine/threonine protein phosphatase PrpC